MAASNTQQAHERGSCTVDDARAGVLVILRLRAQLTAEELEDICSAFNTFCRQPLPLIGAGQRSTCTTRPDRQQQAQCRRHV